MTTAPPTTITQDAAPAERPRMTIGDVFAIWLQNFGGGVGVAILAALVAWWLAAPGATVAQAAIIAGGIAFGALMVLRAVIDEIMDGAAYLDLRHDNEWLNAELDAAEDTLAARELRIAELERELSSAQAMARRNYVSATPAPTDPLGLDVRQLIAVCFATGRNPSRRVMEKDHGWSQSRYARAYSELRRLGVVTGDDGAPVWPASEAAALDILERHAESD